MGSSVICLGILLVGLAISCTAEEVPVFIWGDLEYKSQNANPLSRTSSAQLEHELRAELAGGQTLVAFIEQTLSVEDLSHRDTSGATLLPYLRSNLKDSLYYAAVRSPVDGISQLADDVEADRISLTASGLSAAIRPSSAVVIVELSDAREDEPRADMLRRHDQFIRETVDRLRKEGGRVVAVYTAHYPSWVVPEEVDGGRFRRQLMQAEVAAVNNTDSIKIFNSTHLILAVSSITLTKATGAPVSLTLTDPTVQVNATHLSATVQDAQFKVTLRFIDGPDANTYGYWMLNEADVTELASNSEEKFVVANVYAQHNFSYHCGSGVAVSGVNGTYTLALNNLQVQPFFNGDSDHKFGDYYDCVGFFTVPIWSGLFVLTIMLAIFFYGIMSMMDIRTMDRFDDPKGKTITITATD